MMTDHVSSMLFAPTDAAVDNLRREGITGERVHRSGDVMCDIALAVAAGADARRKSIAQRPRRTRASTCPSAGDYGVVTDPPRLEHRARRAARGDRVPARRGRAPAAAASRAPAHGGVPPSGPACTWSSPRSRASTLLPPLGYVDMTALLRGARVAVTDSGGLQKEAFVHGVPCVTLRDRTEWTETVDAGLERPGRHRSRGRRLGARRPRAPLRSTSRGAPSAPTCTATGTLPSRSSTCSSGTPTAEVPFGLALIERCSRVPWQRRAPCTALGCSTAQRAAASARETRLA